MVLQLIIITVRLQFFQGKFGTQERIVQQQRYTDDDAYISVDMGAGTEHWKRRRRVDITKHRPPGKLFDIRNTIFNVSDL